jgi:hypothetical protein
MAQRSDIARTLRLGRAFKSRGGLDREGSVVKLPMRQLTIVIAILVGAPAISLAQSGASWTKARARDDSGDRSMTVYPAALNHGDTTASSADFESASTLGVAAIASDSQEIEPLKLAGETDDLATSGRIRTSESIDADPPALLSPQARNGTSLPAETARRRPAGNYAIRTAMAPEELPPTPPSLAAGGIPTPALETPLDDSVEPSAAMEVTPWGSEPPAPFWSSGEWFRSGIWYTSADFLVIRRDRPRDRLLIGIDVTHPNRLFFNYGATAGIEPAVRATVGRFIGRDWASRDHSVEVSFLGINEFETGQGIRAQQTGGLILLLDQKQGGMNNADVWTTAYSSRFHTVETDLRLRYRPDKDRLVMAPDGTWTQQYTSSYVPSLLLGLRYINLNEDYSFRSRSLGMFENEDRQLLPISEREFRGDYDIATRNDLLGIQIGGDFINQRETWYWGLRGKAGAYVNFAEQFTVAQFNDLRATGPDAPGDPSIDVASKVERASRANEAFFGEFSLMTGYHFTPNFTARASYDFMWLAGVALAPDQFTFSETAKLSLDGVIFYQGLSLGLEFVW